LENTAEMNNFLKGTGKIITTNVLSKALEPNESTDIISLKGYKLLSNNNETVLDNNAEIIEVSKTGGALLTTTLGNYIPSQSSHEADDAQSESLTIIPPTGLSVDYIAYTLLAISSLGILGAGIIVIKKFVLKRNKKV
jgi:hypothetical protein